jgi:hypothetical protein
MENGNEKWKMKNEKWKMAPPSTISIHLSPAPADDPFLSNKF